MPAGFLRSLGRDGALRRPRRVQRRHRNTRGGPNERFLPAKIGEQYVNEPCLTHLAQSSSIVSTIWLLF